jgi:predicted dehydrogenase
MQVTIALVGIGGYGETYLNELLPGRIDQDVRLVAGIDPQPERCSRLAELKAAGIPLFSDLESFYRSSTADLVVISAPIHLHAPLTCTALSHGSNVLCEKPLAGSLADAAQMLDAEKRSGKFAAVGYQWSFSDATLALKRDILAGRFGRPLRLKTVVLWPRRLSYFQRNDWAGKIRAADGAWVLDSPLNNATAHYLHNMLFLLGSTIESSALPESLEGELYRANIIENYDTAALRATTGNGAELLFLTAHPVTEQRGPLIHYLFEDGEVEYPCAEGDFQARFKDGTVKSYGSPDADNGNKLWQSVEAVRSATPVMCGIRAALPQLICAAGMQQAPIHNFSQDLLRTLEDGSDRLTWVDGLFQSLLDCYASGRLPSDDSAASWGAGKTAVSLDPSLLRQE